MSTETALLPELTQRATLKQDMPGVGSFALTYLHDSHDPKAEIEMSLEGSDPFSVLCPRSNLNEALLSKLITPNQSSSLPILADIVQSMTRDITSGTFKDAKEAALMSSINAKLLKSSELLSSQELTDPIAVKAELMKFSNIVKAVEAMKGSSNISLDQMGSWLKEYGRALQDSKNILNFSLENNLPEEFKDMPIDPHLFLIITQLLEQEASPENEADALKLKFTFDPIRKTVFFDMGDNGKGYTPEEIGTMLADPNSPFAHLKERFFLAEQEKVFKPNGFMEIKFRSANGYEYSCIPQSGGLIQSSLPFLKPGSLSTDPSHVDPTKGTLFKMELSYEELVSGREKSKAITEYIPKEINTETSFPGGDSILLTKAKGAETISITINTSQASPLTIEIPIQNFDLSKGLGDVKFIVDAISQSIKDIPAEKIVAHTLRNNSAFLSGYHAIYKLSLEPILQIEDPNERQKALAQLDAQPSSKTLTRQLAVMTLLLRGFESLKESNMPLSETISLLTQYGQLNVKPDNDESFTPDIAPDLPDIKINPIIWVHAVELIKNSQKNAAHNISFSAKPVSADEAELIIMDDGPGFIKDKLEEYFIEGYTGTSSTGLGLAFMANDKAISALEVMSWREGELYSYNPRTKQSKTFSPEDRDEILKRYWKSDKPLPPTGSIITMRTTKI